MGETKAPERKPTRAREEHANSTQKWQLTQLRLSNTSNKLNILLMKINYFSGELFILKVSEFTVMHCMLMKDEINAIDRQNHYKKQIILIKK